MRPTKKAQNDGASSNTVTEFGRYPHQSSFANMPDIVSGGDVES
jgi:hypothetical protein